MCLEITLPASTHLLRSRFCDSVFYVRLKGGFMTMSVCFPLEESGLKRTN